MNTQPMAVLSTAHITESTDDWLRERAGNPNSPGVADYYYGWFVYCDEEPRPDWPADLIAVMAYVRSHGCECVLLDRDEEAIDELPSYDW